MADDNLDEQWEALFESDQFGLDLFSDKPVCPACGYSTALLKDENGFEVEHLAKMSVKYHETAVLGEPCGDVYGRMDVDAEFPKHLCLHCTTCGFSWSSYTRQGPIRGLRGGEN